MDTREAAADLEVSWSFLVKDRAKGGKRLVPFRRIGRKIIYDKCDLEEFKRITRVAPSISHQRESTPVSSHDPKGIDAT
jgi:hypothetical protein